MFVCLFDDLFKFILKFEINSHSSDAMMNLIYCILLVSQYLIVHARIGDIRIKFTQIKKLQEDAKIIRNLTIVMKPVNRTTTMFYGSGFLTDPLDYARVTYKSINFFNNFLYSLNV